MRKRPFLTVILCLLIALGYLGVGRLLSRVPVLAESFWGGLAVELLLAELGVVILLLIKRGRVLTRGGRGFTEGVKAGGFLFTLLVILVLSQAAEAVMYGREPVSDLYAIYFIAYMFAIGLAEELFFRGIIQNLLADAFGRDSRRGVWLAVTVSGVIFGAVHLSNLQAGVSPLGGVMQAVVAAAIGMYFGAIYARCGNIWPLVVLHGLNDMAGLMSEQSVVEAVSSYGLERLLGAALYVALTAFLLRSRKLEPLLEPAPAQVSPDTWYQTGWQ